MNYNDMSPIERATHIGMRLAWGETVTARMLAEEYGISKRTAFRILDNASRVCPIYNHRGAWRLLEPCHTKQVEGVPIRAVRPL